MSIESQLEKELEILEEQLSNGEIDIKTYNKLLTQLEREARDFSD